jgi:hypothetical protein
MVPQEDIRQVAPEVMSRVIWHIFLTTVEVVCYHAIQFLIWCGITTLMGFLVALHPQGVRQIKNLPSEADHPSSSCPSATRAIEKLLLNLLPFSCRAPFKKSLPPYITLGPQGLSDLRRKPAVIN